MNVTFDWYQTFYYVAKLGSVSLAAEKLFISQPAVSQSIKQLELHIGCKLFVRTSKGVQLTAEGEALFYYIEPGVESIKLGERKLKELLELERGELRIGASDMTLQFYLLPYLEEYHKRHPSIKISVTNGPTPETIELLNLGKIDFGVVTEPFDKRKEFSSRPVGTVQDIFICSKKRAELIEKSYAPEDLVTLPLICLEKNTSSRRHIDDFFASRALSLNPEFELATSDLIVEFVKRDLGIGCVVKDFAKEALAKQDVYALTLHDPIPARSICLLQSSRAPVSKAANSLLMMLETIGSIAENTEPSSEI